MPKRPMTVSDSVVIDVDPMTVYARISDPRQTRNWSPENTGARFDDGSLSTLTVGSSFTGTNKRGVAKWVTRCVVTAADPGVRFTFRVQQIGVRRPRLKAPIATWDYRLEATPDGTKLTETWTDLRVGWPDPVARAFDYLATNGHTFAQFNATNIHSTLRNLKQALETSG